MIQLMQLPNTDPPMLVSRPALIPSPFPLTVSAYN